VHLLRNLLELVNWARRKAVATALRPVYTAINEAAAREALAAFEQSEWGTQYPTIAAAWRRNWERIIPFFAFRPEIRKVIYTTNAIESLHMQLRKIIKTRGHFPNDEAATKLLWLALRNITADWGRAGIHWRSAMNQFAILYADRFTTADLG
jgi:putative transposase